MQYTIIIPAFNAEDTLSRCLDSILYQTFQDYQVVIVDDGSTDETAAIAKEYAAEDSRFRVVRTPNAGPGAARNKGLKIASGEYILYMDADDWWLREDLLEQLEKHIQMAPADVYMYQTVKLTEDGSVLKRYQKPLFRNADTVQALEDAYGALVADGHALAAAWNKCVRRKLLVDSEILFREDVCAEDIDWVLQLFSHVQTICLMNLDAYGYTQHKNTTRSTSRKGPNDLVAIIGDWARRCAGGNLAHEEAVAGLVAFEYGICMGNYHRLSGENKRILQENTRLLDFGLDRKTRLIAKFHKIFGFRLTCLAIQTYLFARRIW